MDAIDFWARHPVATQSPPRLANLAGQVPAVEPAQYPLRTTADGAPILGKCKTDLRVDYSKQWEKLPVPTFRAFGERERKTAKMQHDGLQLRLSSSRL
jgi:hypothetical protein